MHLKKLSRLRKDNHFTQEGLSRKANISYHTLIKLENGGIKNPKIETLIKIAKALGISVDCLISGGKK